MPVLTRAVYKSVKTFAETYDLSIRKAYQMAEEEDFPKIRIGTKGIRVDMSKVHDWLIQKYNY